MNISWNNFESRLSHSFADIRDQEQFLDVTLAADTADGSVEALRAHKVIVNNRNRFEADTKVPQETKESYLESRISADLV